MTFEEAIIYLERADTTVYKEIKTKTAEALEIAIKALEQTDKIEESNFSTEQYKADLQGAYDCGYAKALEQQPRWIPVSERLPEDRELILFSTKTDRVFEGRYFDDNTNRQWYSFRDDTFAWNNVVTAWMPLPEPYKEAGENDE